MALTLDDLYVSPDHYLHSFDGDAAVFVPMDRAAYHRSIFLDDRISAASEGAMHVPLSMFGTVPPARAIGWIFHVAHCGSTLLSRALDDLAGNLVLREPLALRQASVARDARKIALARTFVSKRYQDALPTIVKANVPVNFVLPQVLDAQASGAIFLYLDLDQYLLAILRSDNHREWLRRVTRLLAADLPPLEEPSDARRGAALWLAQMRAFESALGNVPNGRTLDAERFFAEPGAVLRAAADLLGIPLSDSQIAACVGGPLFTTYAKNPAVAFDNEARLERRAALEGSLASEIGEARQWLADNSRGFDIATLKSAALES